MQTFALYARVAVTEPPDWFPAFYARHGAHRDCHITLKQGCWVEEKDVAIIKSCTEDFLKSFSVLDHQIDLTFDSVRSDPAWDCVLLNVHQPSALLHSLQRGILDALKEFRDYEKPDTEAYERNFIPHITIADNMDFDETGRALAELPKDVLIKGYCREIVLIVDGEPTVYLL